MYWSSGDEHCDRDEITSCAICINSGPLNISVRRDPPWRCDEVLLCGPMYICFDVVLQLDAEVVGIGWLFVGVAFLLVCCCKAGNIFGSLICGAGICDRLWVEFLLLTAVWTLRNCVSFSHLASLEKCSPKQLAHLGTKSGFINPSTTSGQARVSWLFAQYRHLVGRVQCREPCPNIWHRWHWVGPKRLEI